MPSNDNYSASSAVPAPLPDAHGHAAFLLVESLIHGLVERSVLTLEQGVDVVASAISVQGDAAREADAVAAPMWHAHSLLTRVSVSLAIDFGKPTLDINDR